jgi:hypothetical protein
MQSHVVPFVEEHLDDRGFWLLCSNIAREFCLSFMPVEVVGHSDAFQKYYR